MSNTVEMTRSMYRILSAILIVAVLTSQSLAVCAHAHADDGGRNSGESECPHVHLHGANHHHHADGARGQSHHPSDEDDAGKIPAEHLPGHDGNTVYLLPAVPFVASHQADSHQHSASQSNLQGCSIALDAFDRSGTSPTVDSPPLPKCALYLQLLSIRC